MIRPFLSFKNVKFVEMSASIPLNNVFIKNLVFTQENTDLLNNTEVSRKSAVVFHNVLIP